MEWNWLVVQLEVHLYIAVKRFLHIIFFNKLRFLLSVVTFAMLFYQMNTGIGLLN